MHGASRCFHRRRGAIDASGGHPCHRAEMPDRRRVLVQQQAHRDHVDRVWFRAKFAGELIRELTNSIQRNAGQMYLRCLGVGRRRNAFLGMREDPLELFQTRRWLFVSQGAGIILTASGPILREFLLRFTRVFGLVPARRYDSLLRTAEELRAGAQAWKQRAGQASARVKELERETARQAHAITKAHAAAERERHRDEDITRLREQLAGTERELILAREHLMAVEVKLDILEGAANVLDARMRAAVGQPQSPSSVPV